MILEVEACIVGVFLYVLCNIFCTIGWVSYEWMIFHLSKKTNEVGHPKCTKGYHYENPTYPMHHYTSWLSYRCERSENQPSKHVLGVSNDNTQQAYGDMPKWDE